MFTKRLLSFFSALVIFFASTAVCKNPQRPERKVSVRVAAARKLSDDKKLSVQKIPTPKKEYASFAPSRLKNLWQKFVDRIPLLELYGAEKASPNTASFVRGIQKEMGMELYNIRVRKFNEKMIKKHGYANACVTPWRTMYISEDWFNGLSHEEKKFVIGHELAHIKKAHYWKGMSKVLIISYMLSLVDIACAKSDSGERTWKKSTAACAWLAVNKMMVFFACCAVGRHHEFEADTTAVNELKCTRGALRSFGGPVDKQEEEQYKERLARAKEYQASFAWHKRLRENFWSLFDSHPSDDERIQNVLALRANSKCS